MPGYNPATLPPPVEREYNEWFVVFTPFFNMGNGQSFIAALLDPDRERSAWLDSDTADTYLKHFTRKSPDLGDAPPTIYEKVAIENRPGKYVIRVRQSRNSC